MSHNLLELIFCPFCDGGFTTSHQSETGFGVLTCYCGEYPVIASIPVLKRGVVGMSGETAAQVVALVKAGRLEDALLAMVMPPEPPAPVLAPFWSQSLPSVRGRRIQNLLHRRAARSWREQATALLTNGGDHVTACDVLDLYYRRSGLKWDDAYDYFALRFGQPRHLVALSFTAIIRDPTKPLLDLACGYGHLTGALARRANGQAVIGVDETFSGLYLAKKFIGPEAQYLCCAADGPLPFPNGYFSVVFCSDAFHYFANKASTVRELRRLMDKDGALIMVWMHNRLFRRPHDGLPLPVEGYQALVVDLPHRLIADSEVLARYLHKKGPALGKSTDLTRLSGEPMISLVASQRKDIFRDYDELEDWPHAQGSLQLNPLYRIANSPNAANVHFQRAFPSAFYLEDHAESQEYLPESLTLRAEVLAALADGKQTPEVERLVRQVVAVGMPARYGKPELRQAGL